MWRYMALVGVLGLLAGCTFTVSTADPTPTPIAPTVTPVPSPSPTPPLSLRTQADQALLMRQYADAIRLYNELLTSGQGQDTHALLGLAQAYAHKTPAEPDVAREYLGRIFQLTATNPNDPDALAALQLLTEIGAPPVTATP